MKAATPYPSESRLPDNVYLVLPSCLATKQPSQWFQLAQQPQVGPGHHWQSRNAVPGNGPALELRKSVSDGRGKPVRICGLKVLQVLQHFCCGC